MIADAFYGLVTALLNTLYAALPTWNATAMFQGGITGDATLYQGLMGASGGSAMGPMGGVLLMCWQLNNFFPVDQAAAILVLMNTWTVVKLVLRAVKWLMDLIP